MTPTQLHSIRVRAIQLGLRVESSAGKVSVSLPCDSDGVSCGTIAYVIEQEQHLVTLSTWGLLGPVAAEVDALHAALTAEGPLLWRTPQTEAQMIDALEASIRAVKP